MPWSRRSLRLKAAVAAIAVVVAATVAACAAGGDSDANPVGTALPAGISVSVYQTRTDTGPRAMEVSIRNETDATLTITRLELRSEQWVTPAVWPKASTRITAGFEIDLRVSLTEPACDAVSPVPIVEFDYAFENGVSGTAITEADDRLHRLPALAAEDCLSESVAAVAEVRAESLPRAVDVGGVIMADIDLTIEPSGGDAALTFATVASTTLFFVVDPITGVAGNEAPVGVTVTASDAPSIITLRVTPNRCDPHAIAEDKRGTVFPIAINLDDGTTGRLYVASADVVRAALYDVIGMACG